MSSHRLIVDELIASHNGRITGTAGDSVLAEFGSVVHALDCAMKIQDALAVANKSAPPEHRLLFRIGINVGDVMLKDGDIFGDGVNIAARLEILGRCRRHLRIRAACAITSARWVSTRLRIWASKASRTSLSRFEHSVFVALTASTEVETAEPPTGATAPSPAEKQAGDPAEFELAFWDAMKESKDPAEFTAYLEQYPAGAFAALAEARLEALLATEPSAEAASDGLRSRCRGTCLLGHGEGQR